MAVSKFAGFVGRSLAVILLVICSGAVAKEACRWDIFRAPSNKLCRAPQSRGFKIQCGFMAVLSEELCRSELRASPRLDFTFQHIDGYAGGVIRIKVSAPGRKGVLNLGVHWNFYPTDEDYRRDARELINEIVTWLHGSPEESSPFFEA